MWLWDRLRRRQRRENGSWRKLKRLTSVPDFDRLVAGTRDDLRAVLVEADGPDGAAVGILLFLLKLECACKRGREGVRGEASDRWEGKFPLPASHTLIVLSSEPETILEPSGEKATERI